MQEPYSKQLTEIHETDLPSFIQTCYSRHLQQLAQQQVVQLLCQCTCPTQFPMVRVGDNGKYKVGDKLIIFVRILRRHIMVRVGGGWQELSEFLRVKDPCRSKLYQSHIHASQPSHHNPPHQLGFYNSPALNLSKLASTPAARSRLPELSPAGQHLLINRATSYRSSGQRLISSSASMGWLSSNT